MTHHSDDVVVTGRGHKRVIEADRKFRDVALYPPIIMKDMLLTNILSPEAPGCVLTVCPRQLRRHRPVSMDQILTRRSSDPVMA